MAPKKTKPPRRGRPPIPEEARRSKNLTFRVRATLQENLARAAHASGRSVSEEIEHRLERSFLGERHLIQALEMTYGSTLAGLLLTFGDVVRYAAQGEGGDWADDAVRYARATTAINAVLDAFRPEGEFPPQKEIVAITKWVLVNLKKRTESTELEAQKRSLLGPLLERVKLARMTETGDIFYE